MVNDRVYRSIVDLGEKVIDGDTVTILIPFDGGALGGKTFRLHE
jgi:molybdopterin converting factor small subunit